MNTFNPIYRRAKDTKVVVKFISPDEGYVIDPGSTRFKTGSFHNDWVGCYENCWEPYNYVDTTAKTPDQLELFETTSIKISSLKDTSITRVPNGYVMTSSSGHQLFIKDLSKESL